MKTIETWFLWLMIYSIIGWVYESTICSIGHRKLINRGFLNGPYCPIYGTGAVLVLLVLGRIQNPVLLFFAGAVVTCSLEYLTSWLMEKLFHARWWDYSKRKFNIDGRVCLIGAVVFGAFSVVLVLVFALVFGFDHSEYVTFLPKSITTAIGMGVSEQMGGNVSITVITIIITGVVGNILGEPVLKLFRIHNPIAKGIGLGSSAHAIGTAKAMELGEVEGAMSGLSIAVAGLMTVVMSAIFAAFL